MCIPIGDTDIELTSEPEDFCIPYTDDIDFLAPGQEQELRIPWPEVTRGQHLFSVELDLPTNLREKVDGVNGWNLVVGNCTVLSSTPQKDKWVSIGPNLLQNAQPTNSVGMMKSVAFPSNPQHSNIIYAGSDSGGIFKSTNRGNKWKPIGDGLPALNARAVAVDPGNPDIVYVATLDGNRYQHRVKGKGIFKSIDGGKNWFQFASENVVGNVKKLVVRRISSNNVLIYSAGDKGLMRFIGNSRLISPTTINYWDTINNGKIFDMAVHPTDNSTVYASVVSAGLYRTRNGAEPNSALIVWTKLTNGLPTNTKYNFNLDIWKERPETLVAAVRAPLIKQSGTSNLTGPNLGIYYSHDEGNVWKVAGLFSESGLWDHFVRIHPKRFQIYFGGVKLYKKDGIKGPSVVQIKGIHDDMQAFEFDPFDPDYYYILNDGGIWYCKSQKGVADDICTHRNNGLHVTQFYDIGVSQDNPDLMIGGTQDNGTILYEGNNWNFLYEHPYKAWVNSLAFAPTDINVLYVVFSFEPNTKFGIGSRIVKFKLNLSTPTPVIYSLGLGKGFPIDLYPRVITGDAHNVNIAYVGTNQGGIYRYDASEHSSPYAWQPYNNGLPCAVEVKDLLVDPSSKELRAATWGRGAWSVVTGP